VVRGRRPVPSPPRRLSELPPGTKRSAVPLLGGDLRYGGQFFTQIWATTHRAKVSPGA
jgi:hypothetical protein